MFQLADKIRCALSTRRGQILLPAVMLGPLFILLVYLLFEMSKLSMTKVRQQFALDSSAYSQMSAASGYLNALAQVNGALPYRVMKMMNSRLTKKSTGSDLGLTEPTVFDVFYKAGAFAAVGPNHGLGGANDGGAVGNPSPDADSVDWNFKYYKDTRQDWLKEEPKDIPHQQDGLYEHSDKVGNYVYVLTDQAIADNYFFGASGFGVNAIKEYLKIYAYTGDIYKTQTFAYNDVSKNARMFRESYYLNTKDCRRSECGKEAASVLDRYLITAKPWEINYIRFYVTADYAGSTQHSGAYPIDFDVSNDLFKGSKLFQFAYLAADTRGKMRQLDRGIHLKQKYAVPANRFNINLTQKYNPIVQNSVSVSCPRSGNNCVWPNPLPKYSVKVGI